MAKPAAAPTQLALDPLQQQLHAEFLRVFDAWVLSLAAHRQPLMPSSIASYRTRAGLMAAFFAARRVDLTEIKEADVEALLESLGAASPQRARYLTLLEALNIFAAAELGVPANHAAARVRHSPLYATQLKRNNQRSPKVLSPDAKRVFVKWFSQKLTDGNWQTMRNRALFALQLGAGLKPGEALSLRLSALGYDNDAMAKRFEPWKITVPGTGLYPARETPMAKYAVASLAAWLTLAHDLGLVRSDDDAIFMSSRHGETLDASVMQRHWEATLAELGLTGYTLHVLRNTWAASNLAMLPPNEHDDIRIYLGLTRKDSIAPLKRVLTKKVSVV
jgi:integrase